MDKLVVLATVISLLALVLAVFAVVSVPTSYTELDDTPSIPEVPESYPYENITGVPDISGFGSWDNLTGVPDISGFGSWDNLTGVPDFVGGSFTYRVYVNDSDYYAEDVDGEVFTYGSDASTVIGSTINETSDNGGGLVFICVGDYVVSSTIQLRSDVVIKGEGVASHLVLDTDVCVPIFNAEIGVTDFYVENLFIDGNKDYQSSSSYGVTLHGDTPTDMNSGFSGVTIGFVNGSGVYAENLRRIYIYQSFIVNNTEYGFYLDGNHLDIMDCYVANNDDSGVYANVMDIKICDSTFAHNGGCGLEGNLYLCVFSGNLVCFNDEWGVSVGNHFVFIVDNLFRSNSLGGIKLDWSGYTMYNIIVNDNLIEASVGSGDSVIYCVKITYAIISGNMIRANSGFTHCIQLVSSTNTVLSHNIGHSMSGVSINATGTGVVLDSNIG